MRKKNHAYDQKVIPIAQKSSSVVANLSSDDRKKLAINALARTEPITSIAAKHNVSRKFIYQQSNLANKTQDGRFCST